MLEKMKKFLDSAHSAIKDTEHTFLSVIGRSCDEDLISRVVAYCLAKDSSLLKTLIERYVHRHLCDEAGPNLSVIKNVSVYPEKTMGFGRADIFVSLTDADNRLITLTIENKIYSHERMTGDRCQTQVYYDWVTTHYAAAFNIFFYLRPDFNYSCARCAAFENLTYTDLLEMLSPGDDIIIRDFATHIKCALGGGNMTFDSAEKLLLDNYRFFDEKRVEATRKVKAYQEMLIQKIVNQLDLVIVDWRKQQPEEKPDFLSEQVNYGAGIGSYRLYRADWYKENEYYFYVEIKFEYGCLNQIYFQATIRNDEKGKYERRVHMFLDENPDISNIGQDDRYYVIEQQPFFSDQWDSVEWETQFIEAAVQYLKAYMVRMDQVFSEYQSTK
jgi:hypothetical protein